MADFEIVQSEKDEDALVSDLSSNATTTSPLLKRPKLISELKPEPFPNESKINAVLEKLHNWDFDAFEISSLTPYPLQIVTERCLDAFHLPTILHLNVSKLRKFLVTIQAAYSDVPYHNYIHATDVTQTTFFLCTTGKAFDALDISAPAALALLIGAAVHDVNHPGVTGKFLINTMDPIAILYNDFSPLENMHLATAFDVWVKQENNFTENLSNANFRAIRRMVIEIVLSTDNDMHNSLTTTAEAAFLDYNATITTTEQCETDCTTSISTTTMTLPLQTGRPLPVGGNTNPRQMLGLQILLHSADISNVAKPWAVQRQWLPRIMEEFYAQGDKERELNLPISYGFDRLQPLSDSRFQQGFIQAIVLPSFRILNQIKGISIDQCLGCINQNLAMWQELGDKWERPSMAEVMSQNPSFIAAASASESES